MAVDYPSGGTPAATPILAMHIAALTSLVLAAMAPFVAAAPGRDETTRRISYNEKLADAPPDEPGWIELASATPAKHGREFIMVSSDAGPFSQLRIKATTGRPAIRSLRVDYQDGSRKVFAVGKVLGARSRPAYVDLRGPHMLAQVVVVTDRSSSGSYVLEGNTAEAPLVALGPTARRAP
jgi:hypothetical protein